MSSFYTPIVRSYRASALTDVNGDALFTFPANLFAVAPVVTISLETAIADLVEGKVVSLTNAACTVNVRSSIFDTVEFVCLPLVQEPIVKDGITVNLTAIQAS